MLQTMKGSWRTAEAGGHERPGEAVGEEDTASVAVEVPVLKDSYRLHVAGSGVLNRTHPKFLVKVPPNAAETPAFWRCQYHATTTKDSCICRVKLA